MPATLPRVAPDIGPILALVRKTRLLLRSTWGSIGAGLTLGLAFLTLAMVAAADMLVPLVGPWLRLTGLVLFIVPTVVVFLWKGILPLARRLRNIEVARTIESKIPGMHSRLVSCMDLADREKEVSRAFYRKLVNESLERIGKYRVTSVVDFRAVRQALLAAVIGIGLFTLMWLAFGIQLTTALSRVFNPFADLPPASDVALSVEPGTTRVLTGEDVSFVAYTTNRSHGTYASRSEPETLTIELTGNNATVKYPLEKGPDGAWRRTLRGLSAEKGFEHGFTYRVFGGRTWTRQNRIDWAERPVIVETAVRLHFPDYMAIPGPRPSSPKERDVIGPAGSKVEVSIEVEGDVAAGDIQLLETGMMRYPLHQVDDHTWAGTFPLVGVGHYRVELRNDLGHANRQSNENPRYEALADQPPIVMLERPGADLVLSKPDKVPLQIAARDDYGLLDLWLAVQREGEPKFARAVKVKEYPTPNPQRADALVAALDLTSAGFNLKAGETLHYRVEVRDRRLNAEPVVSKDFAVRIAADANAADKRLDQFEKGQDTFRDKLISLIAEQRKIKEKIDQVRAKYDALNTKVQAAVEEAKAKVKPKDDEAPMAVSPPTIDPKDAQAMADLRKELSELFGQEQKNVASATQLDAELKNLAANAQKASLLNSEINKQMQDLSNQFKNTALDPLQDLASKLQQGANPAATPPDLKATKGQSDKVQKNLESLKNRMDALADAQKGIKNDPEAAISKLREDLLKEQGKMTARDLEDLKEFLKNLREELARMQGKQEDLADKTEKAPDKELPELDKKQTTLDELLKKDLDLAKKILDRERARKLRKEFPDDLAAGDSKERKTAPKEENSPPENGPAKKGDNADATKPEKKRDGMDDDEDLFKPALKGEREKLDPRFDKKLRKPPSKPGEKADKRDDLQNHQQDNLRDLDAAQKGLKADEQTLEEMIQSLMNASQKGQPNDPQKANGKSQTDQLMDMLKSEAMKNAQQMAQRAKSAKGQPQQGQPTQPPSGTAPESMVGNSIGAAGVLDELDPKTRATILQLPPRVREELLQGMKSQGPEGYQKFIQDYFRRLSAVPK
ncbi:MAG TPA: hypothetical protein VHR66_13165 [Gemmataceae bacterium]|jgi:hypothetical protein|nr:hypothetical protein [Gemmataceae bacterium]